MKKKKHESIVVIYGKLHKPVFDLHNIDRNREIILRIVELRDGGTDAAPEYYCGNEHRKTPVPVGCWARIMEGIGSYIFSYYGPTINYGTLREYVTAARDLRRIQKGMENFQQGGLQWSPWGPAVSALYRWMQASGAKEVHQHINGVVTKFTCGCFCDQVERVLTT